MKYAVFFAICVGLAGCASDELDPAPNESMTAPELSHAREPRKTAEPPPPIRNDIKKTESSFITQADASPVTTGAPASVNPTTVEPGTVAPLR